jgi:arylsulfatase A-like enzyme
VTRSAPTGGRRRGAVRGAGLAVLGLLGAGVLAAGWRIVFYRQQDDAERVASKKAYLAAVAAARAPAGPNVVVILFDDLGYGDLGCTGSQAIQTPHIDTLARQGALWRNGYSASPYCTGSRAGLMTGRYPVRSGLDHVLSPAGSWHDVGLRLGGLNRRLPEEEVTLPEILAAAGYDTAMVGKWHLGDRSPALPSDRGFAHWFGLLHSNDQGEPVVWRDGRVAESHPIDQTTLTRRYTDEAVAFIAEPRQRPFFLYLAHTFPHVPLHAPAARRGTSRGGLYGDVVEELDASVGGVMNALAEHGLDQDTLVLVTSDNGPWFEGSSGPTRGRKHDIFEGGMRVPFIARWPRRMASGQVRDELVIGVDVLPTVLELAGVPPPPDRELDGVSLAGALARGEPGPERAIYFHQLGVARAVREARFKFHARHMVPYGNPMNWPWAPSVEQGPWLFDLAVDPAESYDVSLRYPAARRHLEELLQAHAQALARNPRGWR